MRAVLWEFAMHSNKIGPVVQLDTVLVTLSKDLVSIAPGNTLISKKRRQKVRKSQRLYCCPFLPSIKVGNQKRTAKKSPTKIRHQKSRRGLHFGQLPKKDGKRSPRPFWTPKGRLGNKVGKKSWHLRSP